MTLRRSRRGNAPSGPDPLRDLTLIITTVLFGILFSACGGGGDKQPPFETVAPESLVTPVTTIVPSDVTTTTIRPTLNLEGVCSNPVVVQLDSALDLWSLPYVHMIAEQGIGTTSSFRAPLLNSENGSPTGVDIELRTAGRLPVGSAAGSVLGDASVLFTTTNINEVLPVTAGHPVIVAAPWARTDLALQWTAVSTSMRTIADIAGSTLTNPTFDQAAADYLRGSRILPDPAKADVLRDDVKGVPKGSVATMSRLLEAPDQASALTANQGLGAKAQLLADVGWEPYPHVVVVSQTSAKERGDCSRRRATSSVLDSPGQRGTPPEHSQTRGDWPPNGRVDRSGATLDAAASGDRFGNVGHRYAGIANCWRPVTRSPRSDRQITENPSGSQRRFDQAPQRPFEGTWTAGRPCLHQLGFQVHRPRQIRLRQI